MGLVWPEKRGAIGSDLRRLIGADKVRDDGPSLTAYAVDAGIYRIRPQAIVLVESEDDIQAVMEYAVRHGISLTPRAAGTNLTGSAIGAGIILDVSRMNRILELNREERWARVQPGIVYAELNRRLAKAEVHFGPDPSSGDMCKLGGMVANNSSGPHTLRHGSVKDNVLALRVCLPRTGWTEARAYRADDPRWQAEAQRHPALGAVVDMIRYDEATIRARRPQVSKNSCGYNVFGVLDGLDRGDVDLTTLFVGSEGTLGVVSEATIRLAPRPAATATVLLHFRRLDEVGVAVPELLTLQPSALEVMDGHTLNLIGRDRHGIPSTAAATLLAEFDADRSTGELRERMARLSDSCRRYALSEAARVAYDPDDRQRLWTARKALYPTLYRYDRKKKPINYVDDVVVRPERLSELFRFLDGFFAEQQVAVAIFGHIGNGNAHIVPLLDIHDGNDFAKMVEGYRVIHETVLERFHGSICGEHGDGRVRAEFVRRMFGDALYGLFVRIKQALDPSGIMNPGVKISDRPFTEHIDSVRLGKPCATCAKCNSVCPVYDVFQSEDMSARGWFEIVTAADYSYLDSKRVVEACLNCKSCRTICPAGVDVSELILRRRAEQPNRTAGIIFALQARRGLFDGLVRAAGATQWLWDRPIIRGWIERLSRRLLCGLAETARIPRELVLPKLARRTLRDRYPELARRHALADGTRRVAYFHGCAANYFDDGVGDAIIALLRRQGIEPDLPPQRCSGTPIQTYGHRDRFHEAARFNLTTLASYDMIVTGCASCTLMLKDYPSVFAGQPEEEQAKRLASRVKHISEVVEGTRSGEPAGGKQKPSRSVTYHSSCHLRAAGVTAAPRRLLASLPGVEYREMVDADRCAGGAGTYVIKDYDTSQRIFDRKRKAILDSGADVVATSCPACMIQLANGLRGTSVRVQHVAHVLHDAVEAGDAEARSTAQ